MLSDWLSWHDHAGHVHQVQLTVHGRQAMSQRTPRQRSSLLTLYPLQHTDSLENSRARPCRDAVPLDALMNPRTSPPAPA